MMWVASRVIGSANDFQRAISDTVWETSMKKLLFVSAFVAFSSSAAFAGGNLNNAFVGQLGFFNTGVVEQGGGFHSVNNALIGQVGGGNVSGIQQGGTFNHNNAATLQFGIENGAIITQN